MAYKLKSGVEYLTHEDSEHDHVESLHGYDNCAPCECTEAKELGDHCRHCYHCLRCSSAVAMGCRPCPSSPRTDIYGYYVAVRRRKDGIDDSPVHDCDKYAKNGIAEPGEWCSCMMAISSPEINPVTPIPSDDEDVAADRTSTDNARNNHDCDKYARDGVEDPGVWCSCMAPPQEICIYPDEPFPLVPSSETLQKQAEEALEKIWGGDKSKMPGYRVEDADH